MPKVLISYRHESDAHAAQVRALAGQSGDQRILLIRAEGNHSKTVLIEKFAEYAQGLLPWAMFVWPKANWRRRQPCSRHIVPGSRSWRRRTRPMPPGSGSWR
jgi:hypothetical protein